MPKRLRKSRGLSKAVRGRINHEKTINNQEVLERLIEHATTIRDRGFEEWQYSELIFLLRNVKRKEDVPPDLIAAAIRRLWKDGKETEAKIVFRTAPKQVQKKLPSFEEIIKEESNAT